ncbi:response regulator [Spirosoma sp. HMF4905]|uniref:Response regulator n=1 Tax=Spirosoma arboris TaxID=2682092 RepID=A0A7K1S3N9_9BACT|nr:response regulator [Spirosoma arboris]MVM28437.1 response regulator [Spirosoma arboris]
MPTSAPCVFVADDDEDDRYLLAIAFQQHSPQCRLLFAQDGRALLDELEQARTLPCLILLDLNMPRLNGFETLQLIRAHPLYQDVPIVMLTTSDLAEDRQRAQALGATAFITKPLNASRLGEVVGQLRAEWLAGKCT